VATGLSLRERVNDLRDFHGAVWVESPAEMLRRMTSAQRAQLGRLASEQVFLLHRGRPSPRLDSALSAEPVDEMAWRVASALAGRRLMRRALGETPPEPAPRAVAMDVLSLCSGIGGLDIGVKSAVPEARVVAYVEGAAPCQEILLARMADGVLDRAPVYGNVTSFDCEPWRGLVDCVVGGYPCQPFSTAGTRRGASDPRHIWPHVARIVGECGPEWCLFENVRGHLSLGAEEVVADLVGMGYRVALGLFTARELRAPHRRERLFILGHRGPRQPAAARQREPLADRPGGRRGGVPPVGSVDEEARGQEAVPAARSVAAVDDPGRRRVPDGARPGLRRPRWPEVWRTRWGYPCSWPPHRDSWTAWRGVRGVDPSLLPAAEAAVNPAFVEWLMGFPRGWTEGLPAEARLRTLGNAVVPAVAALAWRELSAAIAESEAPPKFCVPVWETGQGDMPRNLPDRSG